MAGTVGARRFTDKDKARVLATLAANDGNVKRTSRETGVGTASIRRMRESAKTGSGPPAALVAQAVTNFTDDAERVRNKALQRLEALIESGDINAAQLITAVGVLDDKIRLAKALPTSITQVTSALPPREELRELMAGFVEGAIAASERRQGEIVDAEIVEPLAISA